MAHSPTEASAAHSGGPRRLFVGDLHGCLHELDELLQRFGFRAGIDRLYSVGDIIGKGPEVTGTLRRLRDLGAGAVLGNHDVALLESARLERSGRKPKYRDYIDSLGDEAAEWIAWLGSWPYHLDLGDILLVHAGLQPDIEDPARMAPRILTQIRTWDGKGEELNREGDPPWFECLVRKETIVFGHWAKRGLIDLPRFKGLDTGCVYGRKLTGWCPEENRFYAVPARKAYAPIRGD